MDPLVDLLFVATALLTIAVALRRLRRAEAEIDALRAGTGPAVAADPPEPVPAARLAAAAETIVERCRSARDAGPASDDLDAIELHARRIVDLLARPSQDAPARGSERRPLDPVQALRSALARHDVLGARRGVSIHTAWDPLPLVEANPQLLEHALSHLVLAAVSAAPEGSGDVTVAAGLLPNGLAPEQVAFAVADDGPGLEPEELAWILDPELETAGERRRAAAISLAAVFAASRALQAEFVLDTAPGAGTRATLKLPVAEAAQPSAPRRVAAPETVRRA